MLLQVQRNCMNNYLANCWNAYLKGHTQYDSGSENYMNSYLKGSIKMYT